MSIKRMLIAAFGILALLAIITVALPFAISSDSVRTHLLQRAKEVTGREMAFSGNPRVSLRPFLGIEINDVVFRDQFGADSSTPILSMPKLKGRLSLAAALSGEVKLTEFQFVRPKFNLKIYSTGQSSWQFPEGKVWATLDDARRIRSETPTNETPDMSKLTAISLGKFTILDGIIEYENEITGNSETITNFNGILQWTDTRSPWSFDGNGIWRGDVMRMKSSAQSPLMLMAGGSSAITAQIESEPLKLDFVGEANRLADLFVSGKINARSPSLRRLINLLGGNMSPGSSFGDFVANGKISGTVSLLKLDEAQISLDGNEGSGSLRFEKSETNTNSLNGTIAFSEFNLSPYLHTLNPTGGADNHVLSEFALLNQLDMDLRLSASTVKTENFSFANFAGGMSSKNGMLVVNIGNAEMAEGLLVGSVEAGIYDDQISISTNINVSGIDTSELNFLSKMGSIQPIGKGNIQLKLTSKGTDVKNLTRNLTGEAVLKLKNGVLNGIDLTAIKAAVEGNGENKIAIGANANGSNFSILEISALINRGVGWITNGNIESDTMVSSLVGKLDLHLGTLALRGRFIDPATKSEALPKYLGNYFIGGTLEQPLFVSEKGAAPANSAPLGEDALKEVTPSNPDVK